MTVTEMVRPRVERPPSDAPSSSGGSPRRTRRRWSLRLPIAGASATILAAICLGETFLTARWFLPTAFGVAAVVVSAELARRRSVARGLVPVAGLIGLVVYLVVRYAHDAAAFGFLPDRSALERLLELAAAGNKDIARYAAPIEVSPGIELITVAGVGLIALLVDTLAVTARRAPLAGLPLLALYTVPAALAPDGVTWQAFALAGAGYLALLLTESRERVTRWGRPLRFSPRTDWHDDVQVAPLTQLGRRVGAAALGLALVVPAVLPEISMGTLGFGSGGFGRGNGVGKRVAVVNPIVDLGRNLRQGENRTVIRYEGPATYLRMVALDEFDGTTWKPSRLRVPDEQTVDKGLPRPAGLDPSFESGRNSYTIHALDIEQRWLPLPYPARKVSIEGRWLYDDATFNVFSTNTSTRQKTYRVSSRIVAPTAQQLRVAPPAVGSRTLDRYLELPLVPSIVERTARRVTRSAVTDYDRALALQSFLRDPAQFTYSTEVPHAVGDGNGASAIASFLDARQGYCVHFASAMAIMARLLEIPARVAVGFIPGTRDRDGSYTVGLNDAHSWPELYFEGAGWIAFEPTPGDRTGAPPAWARPDAQAANPAAVPSASASSSPSASSPINPNRTGEEFDSQGGAADDPDKPLWQRLRLPLVPTLVVLGLLVLAMLPSLTRKSVRRRRWRNARSPESRVAAAWDELHDTLIDFGFSWHDSDSPRRGAARVTRERSLPAPAAAAIARLAVANERLRYATSVGEVRDLRNDVALVHDALAAGSARLRRVRARFLPPSTRSLAAGISERIADLLDGIDTLASRMRSRLPPTARRTG